MRISEAMSAPTPTASTIAGATCLVRVFMRLVCSLTSVQGQPALREVAEGVPDRSRRVAEVLVASECHAGLNEPEVAERLELHTQFCRSGHLGGFERDHARAAGFHGRVLHDFEQPQRLDRAVRRLRLRGGEAGENLACGALGVDEVALAARRANRELVPA
jgi:hypothetical protein